MEFTSNSNDSEVDFTAPYYKDYHFQVLKNAIMFEGTQVAMNVYIAMDCSNSELYAYCIVDSIAICLIYILLFVDSCYWRYRVGV